MKSFLKNCALATLLGLALATTVRAAESGSSSVLNTHQGETQSTELAENAESVELPIAEMAMVPERGFSTLSGETLYGIESRNLAKDSPSSFSKTSPISETSLIFVPEKSSAPVIQVPAALEQLSKKIEVNAGESSVDSDQIVKVQYHLNLTN